MTTSRKQPAKLFALKTDISPLEYVLEIDKIITLGRSSSCDIIVPHKFVSRQHAQIKYEEPYYVIYDLESDNGLFVNEQRVPKLVLQDDTVISLGQLQPMLRFHDPEGPTFKFYSGLQQDQYGRFRLNDQLLEITPTEERLLSYLFTHPGKICTREECVYVLWRRKYEALYDSKELDKVISVLRSKLSKIDTLAGHPKDGIIKTHRGEGYELVR